MTVLDYLLAILITMALLGVSEAVVIAAFWAQDRRQYRRRRGDDYW